MSPDVVGYYAALSVDLPTGSGPWLPVSCLTRRDDHEHADRRRSASVSLDTGVHYCQLHGSTSPYHVALALGKSERETIELLERHGLREDRGRGRDGTSGCTVQAYAEAKRLPADFLRSLGITDYKDFRWPNRVLRIPYRDREGNEAAVRLRLAIDKELDGTDSRFRWRKGAKPRLYGLWRLDDAYDAGYVVIVEGETIRHRCDVAAD